MRRRVCAIHVFIDHVEILVPGKPRLFRGTLPDKTVTFAWREVTRVIAFKRDRWIVDCICFAFELNGTETIEVSEEMEGWAALVDVVPVYLAGALRQEEWWDKVVSPTFQPCLTNIYLRA
jgi:hypothetical protein